MQFLFSDTYLMEELLMGIVTGLTSSIPSIAFGIATYVFTALAMYTVAARRGISKPWLSWIPVVNVWVLGSLSDQYRYVVKGQYKSKRKILLVLNILTYVLSALSLIVCGVMVVELAGSVMHMVGEEKMMQSVLGPLVAILGLTLPLIGVSIAQLIIRYMALYDLYVSMDPANAVVFIVLSILIHVTEPFFLFFNRNRDDGMPPRKPEPAYIPYVEYEQPEQTWQSEAPDYE